jgi:hypothetical protein
MDSFTQDDLLQYLYNETSPEKTAAIKAALISDWSLREQFDTLNSAHKRLEAVKLSPRKETINNILNYSEKAVEELSSHF